MPAPETIAICVLTYRRPQGLRQTLASLKLQVLPDAVEVSIFVIDNDKDNSAKAIVEQLQQDSPFPVLYASEHQKGIPYARNKALELAWDYDYIAFIDDDDTADPDWLRKLYAAMKAYDAQVTKGVMEYRFAKTDAQIARLGIFSNPPQKTGESLESAWTNNVLFQTRIIRESCLRFEPVFTHTGGSDHHFFREARRGGARIVMCREAVVHTLVPKSRLSWRWLLRRHARVGATLSMSDVLLWGRRQAWQRAAPGVSQDVRYLGRLFLHMFKTRQAAFAFLMHAAYVFGRVVGFLGVSPREYR